VSLQKVEHSPFLQHMEAYVKGPQDGLDALATDLMGDEGWHDTGWVKYIPPRSKVPAVYSRSLTCGWLTVRMRTP
jgi:hypothetical protein